MQQGAVKFSDTVGRTMMDIVARFAQLMIADIQKNLDGENINASSKLRQSISLTIGERTVELSLEDYYKYIDVGVSGTRKAYPTLFKYTNKMPPVSALKNYIATKGISIKGYSDKKRSARKSIRAKKNNPLDRAAFAMAKSIQLYGIKPTYFYSDVVNEKRFKQLVAEAERTLGAQIIFELR